MSRIVHFEIPSDNPEESAEFYTKAFGWKIQRWGEAEYWLAATGSKEEPGIDGAIMKRREAQQPFVNYIGVENIEDAMKNVEENGGETVVEKTTIPAVGHFAFFKDPDGNIMGLMQNDSNAT